VFGRVWGVWADALFLICQFGQSLTPSDLSRRSRHRNFSVRLSRIMRNSHRWRFDQEKSLQLAALFLKLRGGKMKHLKLIKLMYLSDREAFKRWGHPITGDTYYSMKWGPVLSNTLNLLTNEIPSDSQESRWSATIRDAEDHAVELVADAGTDRLSEAEESLAKEIFAEWGHRNRWDIVDHTHSFPEYRAADDLNRRWPIHYQDILTATGKTSEEANSIVAQIAEASTAKRLLAV
jgi:uncharacterized phage-associated protein